MTKLDKYFTSKYDFGILCLLSENPGQIFAAHGQTIKKKKRETEKERERERDLESLCVSRLDRGRNCEMGLVCSS